MPELPEVEVTRMGIAPHVEGRTIERMVVRQPQLRWRIEPALIKHLKNAQIMQTARRGKYLALFCACTDGVRGVLLIHLGMSGSLRVFEADALPEAGKHDHVDLVLQNGTVLRYHDPRRFGAWLWFSGAVETHQLIEKLGPEPLEDAFTTEYLQAALSTQKRALKLALMDNHIVVGVGNIYANETLFRCKLLPTTVARDVTLEQCQALVNEIKAVLTQAIAAGGSTLRDFVNSDGKSGYFQQQYFVYGRDGEACHECGEPIAKAVIGQRSSFYCPHCQH